MPHSQPSERKPVKRSVNGVLLLDKPHGISSNRAVQIIKRIFSAYKCGHTGTLDPMATGLLPLCLGEATKFSSLLLNADKTYETTIKLGFLSTTGDAEGEIKQSISFIANPTLTQCKHVLEHFIGKILQVPPMHSALKHSGKPLYSYARKGINIERSAREVHIYKIQIKSLISNELTLSIECGGGTYIRTLAEDIGKAMGYGGAYLTKLSRTAIGRFKLSEALDLVELENMHDAELKKKLLPLDCLVSYFSSVILDDQASFNIQQGKIVAGLSEGNDLIIGSIVRLYNQQRFLGLGTITADKKIAAKRLLATPLS